MFSLIIMSSNLHTAFKTNFLTVFEVACLALCLQSTFPKVVFSDVTGLTASEQEKLKEEALGDLIDGQLSCYPASKHRMSASCHKPFTNTIGTAEK